MKLMENYLSDGLSLMYFLIVFLHSVNGFPQIEEEGTSTADKPKINSVRSFMDDTQKQGETLLKIEIPNRIAELNELLKQPEWNEKNMDNLHSDLKIPIPDPATTNRITPSIEKRTQGTEMGIYWSGEAKVCTFISGMAPTNEKITPFVKNSKKIVLQMITDANILKLWISFMVPTIEDGNNFGVDVQKEVINEIESVENESVLLLKKFRQYFNTRSVTVSKIAKFPHIEDYRKAVEELDEKEYFFLWLNLNKIRHNYTKLYDLLIKNMEKLKKPRSSNKTMYE